MLLAFIGLTTMPAKHPYADSTLARFVRQRVLELKPKKSQREIASEAGFVNANMASLIKSGASKLPLDRVPAMARALECDPRRLLLLTLEQDGKESGLAAIEAILGAVVTQNETTWIAAVREASDLSDPPLTTRSRRALFAIFGK